MYRMGDFPTDPKKIRARIKSYERKLRQEKEELDGQYDDSAGKRLLLGLLYLLANDVEGAYKSFLWFENEFPDDSGEEGQCLCWTLTLYRIGLKEKAKWKLRQTMLKNFNIVPYLLGRKFESIKTAKDAFDPGLFYLKYLPKEYLTLWTESEKAWAAEVYDTEEFTKVRTHYIEIERQLDELPPGEERTRLCEELFAMQSDKGPDDLSDIIIA